MRRLTAALLALLGLLALAGCSNGAGHHLARAAPVAAFLKRGVGCTKVADTLVTQRLAARPTLLQPDVPVDKFFTRYDGWAGATTSLGSSWSVVARRGAQVTLTTVFVPDLGGDLATVDPATRDGKNARLVRAAFSHDTLRR